MPSILDSSEDSFKLKISNSLYSWTNLFPCKGYFIKKGIKINLNYLSPDLLIFNTPVVLFTINKESMFKTALRESNKV